MTERKDTEKKGTVEGDRAVATPEQDDDGWIYMVDSRTSDEDDEDASGSIEVVHREAAMDSAAWTHVCPRSFRTDVPLEALSGERADVRLSNATGGQVEQYGLRRAPFLARASDGTKKALSITFTASNVKRPLISIPELVDAGAEVSFAGAKCGGCRVVMPTGEVIPFSRKGKGYLMPLEDLPVGSCSEAKEEKPQDKKVDGGTSAVRQQDTEAKKVDGKTSAAGQAEAPREART